jgi:hydroxymethylbilane synthase
VPSLRLATRGSAQATAQATFVADAFRAVGVDVELVLIETTGDRRTDVPLHSIGGQGVFVKEVQRAVLDGRADLAAHSAKDLPSTPHPGLVIGAFCERRSAADAMVGRSIADLAPGATVATGSVRRRAQLMAERPDLVFAELRGNIPTRLEKVPVDGAIVMAVAALEILGLTERIDEELDVARFVPAVGQGCVAVECRDDHADTLALLATVDHAATRRHVELERAFLAELGSGCSMPVGAHAVGEVLHTFLAPEPGSDADLGVPPARAVVALTGDHARDLELARRAAATAHAAVSGR